LAPYTNPAGYEHFMGRWSTRLAPLFCAFSGISGGRVLDVGCGTAVLGRALLSHDPKIDVVGIDPAYAYLSYAGERIESARIRLVCGAAPALPFADASFDAALALLVLQELPAASPVVREMTRVTRRGGDVGACIWDFRHGMPMFSLFWHAA
jgi:ubiquinone/menaquinone biosynthesis C-methylase UbiE